MTTDNDIERLNAETALSELSRMTMTLRSPLGATVRPEVREQLIAKMRQMLDIYEQSAAKL